MYIYILMHTYIDHPIRCNGGTLTDFTPVTIHPTCSNNIITSLAKFEELYLVFNVSVDFPKPRESNMSIE